VRVRKKVKKDWVFKARTTNINDCPRARRMRADCYPQAIQALSSADILSATGGKEERKKGYNGGGGGGGGGGGNKVPKR